MKVKIVLFAILFLFPSVSFSYTAHFNYPFGDGSKILEVDETYNYENVISYGHTITPDPTTEFGIMVTSDHGNTGTVDVEFTFLFWGDLWADVSAPAGHTASANFMVSGGGWVYPLEAEGYTHTTYVDESTPITNPLGGGIFLEQFHEYFALTAQLDLGEWYPVTQSLNLNVWGSIDTIGTVDLQMVLHSEIYSTELPFEIPPNPVPEPATMFLLGTGFFGLAFLGRKRFLEK